VVLLVLVVVLVLVLVLVVVLVLVDRLLTQHTSFLVQSCAIGHKIAGEAALKESLTSCTSSTSTSTSSTSTSRSTAY